MSISRSALPVMVIASIGIAASVIAADVPQDPSSFGRSEFQANCAVCHGTTGRGDGPLASTFLPQAPPDLTTYAHRYGGSFPWRLAWVTIDGRPYEVECPRESDMPAWGSHFYRDAATGPNRELDTELQVSARIEALVGYLASIQQ